MIAVLQVNSGADGLFGRLLHFVRRRHVRVEEISCPLGSYALVTVYSDSPDWDKVAQRLGRLAQDVVLPHGLTLPPACPVGRFQPRALALRAVKETALAAVRLARIPLYRKAVTLIDPRGLYADFVRELLCHCMTVKVVTQAAELYEAVSEEMLQELGAGIVCADSLGLCEGSVLILCPEPGDAAGLCTKAPVLTAGEPLQNAGCRMAGAPQIRAPAGFAEYIPHGIAPLDFLGALGPNLVKDPIMCELRCGKRMLTAQDIAKYMEQNLSVNVHF